MKIAIGADHGGFELKEQLKEYLARQSVEVQDVGTDSADSCDYPDYAHPLSKLVAKGEAEMGILICGTGLGMSYVANRYPELRAALCHSVEYARLARAHNNANVLCLGGRFTSFEEAQDIVSTFLATPLENESRHIRRLGLIQEK